MVTKLPHTLLIVNPPICYCTLSYRSPEPHGKIVLVPKLTYMLIVDFKLATFPILVEHLKSHHIIPLLSTVAFLLNISAGKEMSV